MTFRGNAIASLAGLSPRSATRRSCPEIRSDYKALNERYAVSFVADSYEQFSAPREISLTKMPLHRALDEIVTLFSGSEWEWRELGFLVVRSPKNPAKNPAAGTMTKTISR